MSQKESTRRPELSPHNFGSHSTLHSDIKTAISDLPCSELFFPHLDKARTTDPLLAAACIKIDGKLEGYALSRCLSLDKMRLLDLCDAEGELHPKLRLYIDNIPRHRKQTIARYEKYKQEISSNIQRAIDEVIFIVTGLDRKCLPDGIKEERAILLRNEHPVLTELYDLLPRQSVRGAVTRRIERGKKISEPGLLFYLSCAEALKHCPASSLSEFLTNYRPLLSRTFTVVCYSSPEKIDILVDIISRICQKLGIKIPPRRKRVPLDEWPSPLREEVKILQAAGDGILIDGLEEKLAGSDLKIRLKKRIRPTSLRRMVGAIETLLFRYCRGRTTLSVKDLLTTTKTEVIGSDGRKKDVYFSPFLTPIRESEKARYSEIKGAGYDSENFVKIVGTLLSLAAYNGIFEYHKIIKDAFKFKIDTDRFKKRKARKKEVIKREGIDSWIEDNWPEYERILTQQSFKRDKTKRSHDDSNKNMRFILFYCRLTMMKVMGYRQRQLRDCVHGVNLKVTRDSVEFAYPPEKMKMDVAVHFRADLDNCSRTHGRLIHTLYLFHKHAFGYVQDNLADWPSNNEALDPRRQFFVTLRNNGTFVRFHHQNSVGFTQRFKRECRKFLKHPSLTEESALLIHPHYVRGAAMDTMIEDKGMSTRVACKYFSVSEKVLNSTYKDKRASQDASRDVMLMNLEMEDLEERKSRIRAQKDTKASSANENELKDLRKQLREYKEREKQYQENDKQKDERISSLEQRIDQLQEKEDKRHEEIMAMLSKSRSNSSTRKERTKAHASTPKV